VKRKTLKKGTTCCCHTKKREALPASEIEKCGVCVFVIEEKEILPFVLSKNNQERRGKKLSFFRARKRRN
jgi:hypothetical protein